MLKHGGEDWFKGSNTRARGLTATPSEIHRTREAQPITILLSRKLHN